jgi:hypothetical protein
MRRVLVGSAAAVLSLAAGPAALANGSARVTRAHFGKAWPLTVASGVVRCSGQAVTFTAAGRTYALNGVAEMQHPGWPQIERIWRKNPAIPGTRIDIGPIIERGLKLC